MATGLTRAFMRYILETNEHGSHDAKNIKDTPANIEPCFYCMYQQSFSERSNFLCPLTASP